MCFMYGAHIMYGASTFAAPGAVSNVRNSFFAGGPAGRRAVTHMCFMYGAHIMYGASIFAAPRAGLM